MRAPRVLIGGGGTGGHLFPGLAVAEATLTAAPGAELLFVGSDSGLERRLVPAAGYRLETVTVGKVKGARRIAQLRSLASVLPATAGALRIVRRFRPDVVVGLGGYASAPVVLASWLARRPIVLLEQNAVPGATNRALSRFADRVVLSYAESAERFPSRRSTVHLGNPVRPQLARALADAHAIPRRADRRRILVLGGSQGAHRINALMMEVASRLRAALPALEIEHQTGEGDHQIVSEAYADWPAARATPFIEDMARAYREADLVVSRAGASTISELTIAGLPALLIPYPFAADDHQAANAAPLARAGGALTFRQQDLDADGLSGELIALLGDTARLGRMSAAMRACGYPRAADDVAALLVELARR